jgi:hypothetical protein
MKKHHQSEGFKDHIELLNFVAKHQKTDRTFWPADDAQELLFKELLREGLISGTAGQYSSEHGREGIYEAAITIRGREFLAQHTGEQKEVEHTLVNYWRRGSAGERIGLFSSGVVLVILGYLLARNDFFKRLIDLIRDVMP